jgi:hypothetical protein
MILTPAMSAFGAIMGFCGVMIWRIREGRGAVTKRKILIPHYREEYKALCFPIAIVTCTGKLVRKRLEISACVVRFVPD